MTSNDLKGQAVKIFFGVLVSLIIVLWFAGCLEKSRTAGYDHVIHYADGTIRVLVDAHKYSSSFLSHSGGTKYDYQYFLITLELDDLNHPSIYGPIGEPNQQANSRYSLFDGTETRRFASNGDFVLIHNVNREWKSSVLQGGPLDWAWGEGTIIKKISSMGYFNRVYSNSKSRVVVAQGSLFQMYDNDTGTRIEDEWLENAFTRYSKIDKIDNNARWITDDLKYFVIFPATGHNKGGGVWDYSFELNGHVYSRSSFGVYFERGDESPRVFPKIISPDFLTMGGDEKTIGAVSIDGELHFIGVKNDLLQMANLEGEIVYSAECKDFSSIKFQHDQENGVLAFFGVNIGGPEIKFSIWHYKESKFRQHLLDYKTLVGKR